MTAAPPPPPPPADPSPAGPPPLFGPPPPPRPGRDLPRWVVGLAATLAVIAVGVGMAAAVRQARKPIDFPALPKPEPAHDVVYWFAAAGTANEDYDIRYTGADGHDERLSLPGIVPGWRQEVRVEEGAAGVALSVSAPSSDFNFKIRCQIEIDGFIEETMEGLACILFVHFPRKSGPREPAKTPGPTKPPAAPKLPASCRYVPIAAAEQAVLQASGVLKTVLTFLDDDGTCRYVFDANAGSIRFRWSPGKKGSRPPTAQRVPGVEGRVYWADYGGKMGTLEAHLPGGVFQVDCFFLGLNIQAKTAALRFLEVARPRLR